MLIRNDDKMIKRENHRRLIGIILVLVILSVLVSILVIDPGWDQCKEANDIKNMGFQGIISEKILDKKNGYEQYIWIKENKKTYKLRLTNEILVRKTTQNSATWEYLEIGDSVKKESGSFIIYIKKTGNKNWAKKQMVFPDCPE